MKRLALHLTLWAAYALVEFTANLPHFSNRRTLAEETLFFLPVIALPFYLVACMLVPNLLWKGRKQLFWLACAVVFLLVMIIRSQWSYWYGLLQYGEGPAEQFLRVHRSFIVSKDKVSALSVDGLEIGKTVIPIGRMYKMGVEKTILG